MSEELIDGIEIELVNDELASVPVWASDFRDEEMTEVEYSILDFAMNQIGF